MKENNLYIHNPEEQEWDVDQSLFEHTLPKQGERSDDTPYSNKQENITADNYDDLYNNSPNVRHTKSREVKKVNNNILTISALLIGSVVGVIAIVNPLTMRPNVTNGKYSFENTTLSYKFNVSNRLGYDCDLVLLKDGVEVVRFDTDETKNYAGEYTVSEQGSYQLDFVTTNNIDYKNTIHLYSFTY